MGLMKRKAKTATSLRLLRLPRSCRLSTTLEARPSSLLVLRLQRSQLINSP